MSRLQDSYWSRKLNNQQRKEVRRSNVVQNLQAIRQRLFSIIYDVFDTFKKAKDSSIHSEYLQAQRLLASTIRAEERLLLQRLQQRYDKKSSIENIERQLSGITSDTPSSMRERSWLAFLKQSRVGEILFTAQPSTLLLDKCSSWRTQLIDDLIALCNRRKRRTSIKRCKTQTSIELSEEVEACKVGAFLIAVTTRNAGSLYDGNSMNNNNDPTIYMVVGDLYVCGGPWVYTRLGKTSLNR